MTNMSYPVSVKDALLGFISRLLLPMGRSSHCASGIAMTPLTHTHTHIHTFSDVDGAALEAATAGVQWPCTLAQRAALICTLVERAEVRI